jgi:hypothetical protein
VRKKLSSWRIIRIRGNKGELVGTVPAADEKSAIKTAINEYKIDKPEQQRRLAARLVPAMEHSALSAIEVAIHAVALS